MPVRSEPPGLRVEAPAKINVDLKVLGRDESGYHPLETHFAAVGLCDVVTVVPAEEGLDLAVEGADLGDPRDNLVYRAAAAFLEQAGEVRGARIRLEKHIPAGAGLGGGSSDAASTLRLLNELYGRPLPDEALADIGRRLGADIPFFLSPHPSALGFDRGDRLVPIGPLPSTAVLLALPPIQVSSADAYARLADSRGGSAAFAAAEHSDVVNVRVVPDWERAAKDATNDFEPVIFDLHPQLGVLRNDLEEAGAFLARLSGSGAAVFGLFSEGDVAEQTAESLSEAFSAVDFVVTETLTEWPRPEPARG